MRRVDFGEEGCLCTPQADGSYRIEPTCPAHQRMWVIPNGVSHHLTSLFTDIAAVRVAWDELRSRAPGYLLGNLLRALLVSIEGDCRKALDALDGNSEGRR